MYSDYEIRTLPLSLKPARQRVERFLASCGLRLDPVDTYAVVTRVDDDAILAGGGLAANVIKCVAVSDALRGSGMMQRLVSHLLSEAHAAGHTCVRVFTKPDNQHIFESLGFQLLARAPKAVFMENGLPGIGDYLGHLKACVQAGGSAGVIVMNANPFTLGHRALVEWAAAQVDRLYVIAVREDVSMFSSHERLAMITAGCRHLDNVTVVAGSDYAISAATFPTYFLKQLDEATDTQITLDLDLFARHIAPALGAAVRFVGSEPADALTARYVTLMQEQLPASGIDVRVMPRAELNGQHISASRVRSGLADGRLAEAVRLVPATTLPYLVAVQACQALQQELDTTPKPGLVDKADSGAHSDMDHALMQTSINALRPHFVALAVHAASGSDIDGPFATAWGLKAEQAMLAATGGVNTHRGAIFALGLAVAAGTRLLASQGSVSPASLSTGIKAIAGQLPGATASHGAAAVRHHHVGGALAMAQGGYERLFADWLPFFQRLAGDPFRCHKTLLRIMTTLDDTNVIHRVGYDRAQQVKTESQHLLDHFDLAGLQQMCIRYKADNISPGGAADMLSLTLLAHALCGTQQSSSNTLT